MPFVNVKNSCSCAIKRAIPERVEYATKEEAEQQANKLLEQMQKEFCKKHCFELKEEFGSFSIYIKTRY